MKLVAIGASYGGLYALMELLGAMPTEFRCPIVIAQHRSAESADSDRLGHVLSRYSALPVRDAEHGEPVAGPGVFLAPADYHLLIEDDHFEVTVDDAVEHSRPSIDVLFESAARAYGADVVGVVLTGFGRDGAQGLLAIRNAGGLTIVQDPESAAEATMPRSAIAAGGAGEILALDDIAPRLMQACKVTA